MKEGQHHAVVFDGDREACLKHAREYVTDTMDIEIAGNPDVSIEEYERFSIDDARALKERASQTPLGEAQVFLIVCDNILREAQNALLKLLEEPSPNTYFIIVLPSVQLLLPTIRSRVSYGGCIHGVLAEEEFAKTFITSTIGERNKMLEPILKDKDRTRARLIVDALESLLHTKGVLQHKRALKEIAFVRRYLMDRSSSLKSLLTHLAVSL